ncbi:hypothetical protein SCALM49S_07995 [Streptomyces californicus]
MSCGGVSGASAVWPSLPCSIQTCPVAPRSTVRCGPSAVPFFSTVYGKESAPFSRSIQANAP